MKFIEIDGRLINVNFLMTISLKVENVLGWTGEELRGIIEVETSDKAYRIVKFNSLDERDLAYGYLKKFLSEKETPFFSFNELQK